MLAARQYFCGAGVVDLMKDTKRFGGIGDEPLLGLFVSQSTGKGPQYAIVRVRPPIFKPPLT